MPFRKVRFRPARKPLFWMAGIVAFAMLTVGGAFIASAGAPHRLSPEAAQAASYLEYRPEAT